MGHIAPMRIAADAERAIAQMIKDGVMKAQNAPATPIKGFDDANKYVNNYPTAVSEFCGDASGRAPTGFPQPRRRLEFVAAGGIVTAGAGGLTPGSVAADSLTAVG